MDKDTDIAANYDINTNLPDGIHPARNNRSIISTRFFEALSNTDGGNDAEGVMSPVQ
jgi:hypothetical protein